MVISCTDIDIDLLTSRAHRARSASSKRGARELLPTPGSTTTKPETRSERLLEVYYRHVCLLSQQKSFRFVVVVTVVVVAVVTRRDTRMSVLIEALRSEAGSEFN